MKRSLVARMGRFAQATLLYPGRGRRQPYGNEVSQKREKQQQSGGQAMHFR
jgi:hypothetical protein